MKKAIILVLMLVITLSIMLGTCGVAFASEPVQNGTYRARTNITVYTQMGRTDVALFEIPSTYYFDIVDSEDDIYYIEYNDIADDTLFIKSDADFVALDNSKDVGTLGGFSVELTLTQDCTFYKKSSRKFENTALTVSDSKSIVFMGFGKYQPSDSQTEIDMAFVLLNNTDYGYLEVADLKVKGTETMLADYTIDLHPNYRVIENTDNDNGKTSVNGNKLTRTILIIGIVVPALIIVALLFKPNKHNRYDYDRNNRADYGTSPYDQPRSRYRDDYYEGERPMRRRNDEDDYDNDYYGRR